jgi:hypothetical protein
MIAGAGVMAVPDAVLLFAVGRAHARIHVKHDAVRRATTMDDIDPLAGKIGERQQVLFGSEPLRLEVYDAMTTYTYTTIDPPGGVFIDAMSVNNSGQVAGYIQDSSGHFDGFLDSGGTYTTINPPGSVPVF